MCRKIKKIMLTSLVGLILSGVVLPVTYDGVVYAEQLDNKRKELKFSDINSEVLSHRIELMVKIQEDLELTGLNFLKIKSSDQKLKEKYNLSVDDITLVHKMIDDFNEGVSSSLNRAYIDDWHLILTADDCRAILHAVNVAGPVAVAGALAAVGSSVPGAGTVIGAVVGFFGTAAIVSNATYAVLTNRKLKLGLTGVSVID